MTRDLAALARRNRLGSLLGSYAALIKYIERSTGPLLDLFIRLWLAQIFWMSGLLKLADWQHALELSRNEYPVSWMDPVMAAYVGIGIELLAPVLLAFGLATRFAAFALLTLSLVIQFNYLALDAHLFWAALFAWYVIFGAGPISIDARIAHGLADTAIPFAAPLLRIFAWVTRVVGPAYQFLLRGWLAVAVLLAFTGSAWLTGKLDAAPGMVLPLKSATQFGFSLPVMLALLLLPGFMTRLSAWLLIAVGGAILMLDWQQMNFVYWFMGFALLAIHGASRYSFDHVIARRLAKHFPQLDGKPAFSLDGLPRVVIVGAGFGGLACAHRLARTPVRITLVDRHNYHLFQPLLYQVATTALSPGDIAMPIRGLFRDQFNVRVLLSEVTGIDKEKQEVMLGNERLAYDYLVLATGAQHSYFGRDDWAAFAPGLKRVEDATRVRGRILSAFEHAEATDDANERAALLTFLIVGGGPTGVELAGAIAELARYGMEKEFRNFDPATARVILVQSGPRVLPTFPEKLSAITQASLEKLGVEVMINSKVEQIDAEGVTVNGKRLATRTVLWAAGVVASPAAKWLGAESDYAGRIKVGPDLSVACVPNVFAIGDTALSAAWASGPVPGLAPAAKQGGEYVAKLIAARIAGHAFAKPFRYLHLGSLATIGRKSAVADFSFLKVWGAPAWWLWGVIHIGFLVGVRNRVSVMFDWFWAYLTFRSGTRLITASAAPDTRQATAINQLAA